MAKKPTAAEPVIEVDLRGMTGPQIAEMIVNEEIDQASAERFVADRAVRKLNTALARLQTQA